MPRTPEEEKNHALVMGMFENVLSPLNSAEVDRYVAKEYKQHSSLVATGSDGLKAFLDSEHAQFPNAVHDLKRTFVEGNHVFCHYHVRRFEGDPGLAVMDIFRVEGDKIVEHWDVIQPVPESTPNPNGMF